MSASAPYSWQAIARLGDGDDAVVQHLAAFLIREFLFSLGAGRLVTAHIERLVRRLDDERLVVGRLTTSHGEKPGLI